MLPRKPTSRRDFLQGRSAVRALDDLVASVQEASRPEGTENGPLSRTPPRAQGTHLLEISRPAMACEFEVLLNAGEHAAGPQAAVAALDLVAELEEELSVYRASSAVSQLNRGAGQGPMPVSPRLFGLLELALHWGALTGGAADITAGPLTKAWGFYGRQGRVPTSEELAAARDCVGLHHVRLDRANRTVTLERPGMELNLGAVGKGFALDLAVEVLLAAGVPNFLMHGGASSVVARGHQRGQEETDSGWVVGLKHPLRPDRRLAEFFLRDRALGTSGSGREFFLHGGERYGHILDPRTGHPATGVLQATVLAPSAALADLLSTAFYVLGLDAALAWCQRDLVPNLAAAIVTPGPHAGSVQLHTHGLSPADWRLAELEP